MKTRGDRESRFLLPSFVAFLPCCCLSRSAGFSLRILPNSASKNNKSRFRHEKNISRVHTRYFIVLVFLLLLLIPPLSNFRLFPDELNDDLHFYKSLVLFRTNDENCTMELLCLYSIATIWNLFMKRGWHEAKRVFDDPRSVAAEEWRVK